MKKHHKFVIGSFSMFLIILLIANSIFVYFLYGKLQYDYHHLSNQLETTEGEIKGKINDITISFIETQSKVDSLSSEVGSIDKEFDKIKASTSDDFSGIIEKAIKSVITIRTDFSQGTGFILSKEGYVVTNDHIIKNAKAAIILDYQEEKYRVKLIGNDSEKDIALLKINGTFDPLELGDSDEVSIGEKVIAIGNPLGLRFSVSEGIVSGTHRPGPNDNKDYIQTDAALNPGNSGGPLINREGKVIGINNFKIGGGESLGFALESNKIKESVNKISQRQLNETIF